MTNPNQCIAVHARSASLLVYVIPLRRIFARRDGKGIRFVFRSEEVDGLHLVRSA